MTVVYCLTGHASGAGRTLLPPASGSVASRYEKFEAVRRAGLLLAGILPGNARRCRCQELSTKRTDQA
jgi:hypothetical protein